jgi:putative phage-type endonuclease
MHITINDLEPLINVIDSIQPAAAEYFTEQELISVFETCLHLADDYITSNPTCMSESDFDENIYDDIEEIVEQPFLQDIFYDDAAQNMLEDIITYALEYYFDTCMPLRTQVTPLLLDDGATVEFASHEEQIISNAPSVDESLDQTHEAKVAAIAAQIEYLRSKPQPTQRTPEWYTFRHNLITASNAFKAFDTQSSKNQLIFEKCMPIKYGSQRVSVTSPLHWGQKYEPISVMYYESKYSATVQDFGCIQHDKYSFLGASPDGINVDPATSYYGRMLEIKNPVSREITGVPKKEYWIQMQLQMETCNLDECDFLETKFTEYESMSQFNEDGDFLLSGKGELKGVMMYFTDMENLPHYEYKPLTMDKEEFTKWEEETMLAYEKKNMLWIKNNYWKLAQVSCVLVLRNKQWFELNIDALKEIWAIIEKERITGYAHRAPKSKQNALASQINDQTSNQSNQSNPTNKITNYINTSQLTLTKLNCDNNEETYKKKPSGCLLHLRMDKETGIITVIKK